jgi:hypothetical protein
VHRDAETQRRANLLQFAHETHVLAGRAEEVEPLRTRAEKAEAALVEANDRLYRLAPWGTLPGDATETNRGRSCACGAPMRAGTRLHHVCDPQALERALADSTFRRELRTRAEKAEAALAEAEKRGATAMLRAIEGRLRRVFDAEHGVAVTGLRIAISEVSHEDAWRAALTADTTKESDHG